MYLKAEKVNNEFAPAWGTEESKYMWMKVNNPVIRLHRSSPMVTTFPGVHQWSWENSGKKSLEN